MHYGPDPIVGSNGHPAINPATVLDNTEREIREGSPADAWRSIVPTGFPGWQHSNSLVIQACLVLIEAALKQRSVAAQLLEGLDVDLNRLAEMAELTKRETDVIALAGNGWNQTEIARWLDIDQATVSRRLRSGRVKLAERLPDAVAHQIEDS